jgi:hypothetical protein
METGKNHTINDTELININGNSITDRQLIANSFNNYFLTVAEKVSNNINNNNNPLLNCNNPTQCFL